MAKKKKEELTIEEKMEQALVPENEWPYQIPENWVWVRFEAINNYMASSIDPSKDPEKVFELYSVPSYEKNYPELIFGKNIGSTKQNVNKNDVLLCKINPRINRVWIVKGFTENDKIASSEWVIIRNHILNPMYLLNCFKSAYFREFLLENVSGVGGSLMRAQPKYIKEYPVPIPPFLEQQRIVDRIESLFEKLDRAKELIQEVIDSYENRKAAILHQAFSGELTKKWREENVIGMDSWEEKRLGDVVVFRKEKYDPTKENDVLPYIGLENISKNEGITGIQDSTVVKSMKNIFKNGDILYGKLRPYLNKHDIVDFDGICSTDILVITSNNRAYLEFINYYLDTSDFIDYAVSNSQGINLPRISEKVISEYICRFPTLEEVQEVNKILKNIFNESIKAKKLLDHISEIDFMKKAILSRAFCGELGTNNPQEENAVELLKEIFQ